MIFASRTGCPRFTIVNGNDEFSEFMLATFQNNLALHNQAGPQGQILQRPQYRRQTHLYQGELVAVMENKGLVRL
ncbi:MAG: hypothetical protein IAE81_16505 [Caldilineaceae bacterium]|jgi:hypothetical protein|nr:hypothetical protein [Caldilineaceae bacterium]